MLPSFHIEISRAVVPFLMKSILLERQQPNFEVLIFLQIIIYFTYKDSIFQKYHFYSDYLHPKPFLLRIIP